MKDAAVAASLQKKTNCDQIKTAILSNCIVNTSISRTQMGGFWRRIPEPVQMAPGRNLRCLLKSALCSLWPICEEKNL